MTVGINDRCYRDDYELLCAELARLDLRIALRLTSGALVDGCTAPIGSDDGSAADDAERARVELVAVSEEVDARTRAGEKCGLSLALPRMAEMFGLDPMEAQALVLCLAPQLRIHYDRVYGRLGGDVGGGAPTVDLILNLLCDSEAERWSATRMFHASSTLMRWQLLRCVDTARSIAGVSELGQTLHIDPRITRYLLGDNRCDVRLDGVAVLVDGAPSLPAPDPEVADTAHLMSQWAYAGSPVHGVAAPVVYLHGPAEAGPLDVVRHLADAASMPVLKVDTPSLLASGDAAAQMRVVCREAVLQQAAVCLDSADALLQDSARSTLSALRCAIADSGRPLILTGQAPWTASTEFGDSPFRRLTLRRPAFDVRHTQWRRELAGVEPEDGCWSQALASRFVLTAHQIHNAAQVARPVRRGGAAAAPTLESLTAACRAESDQDLGELAVKVDIDRGWGDLVLPDDKIDQLREICDQIRHRHVVYSQWGFGDPLGRGCGVTALFCGPPGTGKTIAAQIVAGEAGLPLYKIDLSGVVSKYIGETEKNLAKIFDRARAGNAVLFFDEADALFGKRTAVSDAHDRYANIETSYLLQKLEEHDGVVLLASNLRANLDDAFTRRIRCVVEFPFPDRSLRRRIWQAHFPPQAPVADEVDLDFLAGAFPVAGGNIRNIALFAAFLAAADGRAITPENLVAAARREYDKLGKLWSGAELEHRGRS